MSSEARALADKYRKAMNPAAAALAEALHEALNENERQRKVASDLAALCDADEAASLRPAHPDFEPIEVPWTVAVRAVLAGVPVDSEEKETPK